MQNKILLFVFCFGWQSVSSAGSCSEAFSRTSNLPAKPLGFFNPSAEVDWETAFYSTPDQLQLVTDQQLIADVSSRLLVNTEGSGEKEVASRRGLFQGPFGLVLLDHHALEAWKNLMPEKFHVTPDEKHDNSRRFTLSDFRTALSPELFAHLERSHDAFETISQDQAAAMPPIQSAIHEYTGNASFLLRPHSRRKIEKYGKALAQLSDPTLPFPWYSVAHRDDGRSVSDLVLGGVHNETVNVMDFLWRSTVFESSLVERNGSLVPLKAVNPNLIPLLAQEPYFTLPMMDILADRLDGIISLQRSNLFAPWESSSDQVTRKLLSGRLRLGNQTVRFQLQTISEFFDIQIGIRLSTSDNNVFSPEDLRTIETAAERALSVTLEKAAAPPHPDSHPDFVLLERIGTTVEGEQHSLADGFQSLTNPDFKTIEYIINDAAIDNGVALVSLLVALDPEVRFELYLNE